MYRIYRYGRLVKEVKTIEEVMEWVISTYPGLPSRYYRSVRELDAKTRNGRILCWLAKDHPEIRKGEDEMTAYTSW